MVWVNDCYPTVTDCTFENIYSGGTNIYYYAYQSGPTSPEISRNSIAGGYCGIRIDGNSSSTTPIILGNQISETSGYGVHCSGLVEGANLQYMIIQNNDVGMYVESGVGDIHDSDFINNNDYGLLNESGAILDAANNYWGHATGPTHTSNPGGVGDRVSDDVNFLPFSGDPVVGEPPTIWIAPSRIDVDLFPEHVANDTIRIGNSGLQPIEYNISEASSADKKSRTDIEWLSVNPLSGIVEHGQSATIDVMVSSEGMPEDQYTAFLIVSSNDPDNDLVVVPVQMNVSQVFIYGPADGDTVAVGSSTDISWDAENPDDVAAVDLWYSVDGGQTFPHLIAEDLPNTPPFTWTVGGGGADSCQIQIDVEYVGGESCQNISRGYFTIVEDVSNVTGEDVLPQKYSLMCNYPNPFNPRTTIIYDLPEQTRVDLVIYDIAGRLVSSPVRGEMRNVGRHRIVWDGRDLNGRVVAAGVYFYRLETPTFVDTRRMTLIK